MAHTSAGPDSHTPLRIPVDRLCCCGVKTLFVPGPRCRTVPPVPTTHTSPTDEPHTALRSAVVLEATACKRVERPPWTIVPRAPATQTSSGPEPHTEVRVGGRLSP